MEFFRHQTQVLLHRRQTLYHLSHQGSPATQQVSFLVLGQSSVQTPGGWSTQKGFLGEGKPLGLEDGQGWAASLSKGVGAGRLRWGGESGQDSRGPEMLAKALPIRDWPARSSRPHGSCRAECPEPLNPCV